jgi:hypothetical protein
MKTHTHSHQTAIASLAASIGQPLPLMFSRHASAIDAIIEDAYAIIDADY